MRWPAARARGCLGCWPGSSWPGWVCALTLHPTAGSVACTRCQGFSRSPQGQEPPPHWWWLGSLESAMEQETKCPFSLSPGKMSLYVCAEVNDFGLGERRREGRAWAGSVPTGSWEPSPHMRLCVCLRVPLCAGGLCISILVYLHTSCVYLTHHLCFSFLVLGSFPHPRQGSIILTAFYSSLLFFCSNLPFWKLLPP